MNKKFIGIEFFNILIVILLSNIDVAISLFTFYYLELSLGVYVGSHIIILLIVMIITRNVHQTYSQIPYFIIIIPGVGGIILLFIILLNRLELKDASLISDYEHYISYQNNIHEVNKGDLDKNVSYMNLLDLFRHMSSERKKEALIDAIDDGININIDVLKNGLLDDDPEVVHYTASTLKFLEKKFEGEISEAKENYEKTKEIKYLIELIKKTEKYLGSGLVDSDMMYVIQKQYTEYLIKMIELRSHSYEYYYKLLELYLDCEDYKSFIKLYRKSKRIVPTTSQLSYLLMKYKYKKGKYSEVHRMASKLKEMNITFENYQVNLSFWCSEL